MEQIHPFSMLKISDLRNLGCFLELVVSFSTESFTIDNANYTVIHTYKANVTDCGKSEKCTRITSDID